MSSTNGDHVGGTGGGKCKMQVGYSTHLAQFWPMVCLQFATKYEK